MITKSRIVVLEQEFTFQHWTKKNNLTVKSNNINANY